MCVSFVKGVTSDERGRKKQKLSNDDTANDGDDESFVKDHEYKQEVGILSTKESCIKIRKYVIK